MIDLERKQVNNTKDILWEMIEVVLITLIILIPIPNTYIVPVTYFDTVHHGSVLKPALDVMEGMVLYRDSYTQYGPLPVWLQAVAMLLFGKHILVIYLLTGATLSVTFGLLHLLWRRIMPWWHAIIAGVALLSWLPYAGLPWPNYYLTMFTVLASFLIVKHLEGGSGSLLFLSGISTGLACLCRQQGVIVLAGLFFFLATLPLFKPVSLKQIGSKLAQFSLGALLVIGSFFAWLTWAAAFNDWFLQTVRIIGVAYGQNQAGAIQTLIATGANLLKGVTYQLNDPEHQISMGAPKVWAFITVVLGLGFLRPFLVRLSGKKINQTTIIIYLLSCIGLAGWFQAYPLPDPSRHALGLAPGIGLFVHLIWYGTLRKIHPLLAIAPMAALMIFLFIIPGFYTIFEGLWAGYKIVMFGSIPPGIVKIERPTIIKGIYLSEARADFYDKLDKVLTQYVEMYPNTKLVSTGVQVGLLTFIDHNENFHPMYLSFWSDQGTMKGDGINHTANMLLYPDYIKSFKEYLVKKHPLVITYGEPIDGYSPIFNHTGEEPVYWANQWTTHPVITLMATDDRASAYVAKYGSSLQVLPQILPSQVTVEPEQIVDPDHPPKNMIDDNITTFLNVATPVEQEFSINLDLGQESCVGRFQIMARQGFPQLFPSKFRVEASQDGEQWQVIAQETAYTLDESETLNFTPSPSLKGRYLRLVGQSREYQPGAYYIQLSEFSVFAGGCP